MTEASLEGGVGGACKEQKQDNLDEIKNRVYLFQKKPYGQELRNRKGGRRVQGGAGSTS